MVASTPEQIIASDRIVLPGVGTVYSAIQSLVKRGLLDALLEAAATKPFLGVCVGFQMLLNSTTEMNAKGFNLLSGTVHKFPLTAENDTQRPRPKVPLMGWLPVQTVVDHPLWGLSHDQTWQYFVHSYYLPADPMPSHCVATAQHTENFVAAVGQDNIFATQFHPEKSGQAGIELYKRFGLWSP